MPGYVRQSRHCGKVTRNENHPHHDWDNPTGHMNGHEWIPSGRWWCPGYPAQPRPGTLPDPDAPPCRATWTGPTGVVWDCTNPEHPSDPAAGYAGSGHVFQPRPQLGATHG